MPRPHWKIRGTHRRGSLTRAHNRRRKLALEQLETRQLLAGDLITWDGGAGTSFWKDRDNWSTDQLPTADDTVILEAGDSVLLTTAATAATVTVESSAALGIYGGTLTADLTVDGSLTSRLNSSVVGDVTIGATGTMSLDAWKAYLGNPPYEGDATFTVTGDLDNAGLLRLRSVGIDQYYTETRLTLDGGTLTNQGTVQVRVEHTNRLNDVRFYLDGPVDNQGLIEVGFNLDVRNEQWSNSGTIDVGSYSTSGGGSAQAVLRLDDGQLANSGELRGTGRIRLDRATFDSAAPLTIDASSPDLWFSNTAVIGTGQLTVAPGRNLLLHETTVAPAVNLEGSLTIRGNVDLDGTLTTSSQSRIDIEGDYITYGGDGREGDGVLTVAQGFDNLGQIRFYGRDQGNVHPNQLGDDVRLAITAGEMVNYGEIWLREPVYDNFQYRYEIAGNWRSEGLLRLDHDLDVTGNGTGELSGSINFGTFTDNQGSHEAAIAIQDATVRYATPPPQLSGGTPRLDLKSGSTLQLDAPLTIGNSSDSWKLTFDNTTVSGPAPLIVAGPDDPEGTGYAFLWNTTIAAPFEIGGTVDTRGTSRISGPLSIDESGLLRLNAYRQGLYNVPPQQGDSLLTIDQGFTNRGKLQLWARKGVPGWFPGYIARLTLLNGEIVNEGLITAPAAEATVTPVNEIIGSVRNVGTVRVADEDLAIRSGTLTNTGQVEVGAGRKLTVQDGVVQEAGTIVVDGTLYLNNQFGRQDLQLSGGAVSGNGIIQADVIQTAGTLEPGSPVGSLTASSFTSTGGVLVAEVSGMASGEYDRFVVSGNYSSGGVLRIVRDPAYTPSLGDSVQITQANPHGGTFDRVTGRLIDATTAWDVAYDASGVTLTAVTIDEATLAELLRIDLNDGIEQVRNSLEPWVNASQVGVPSDSKRLGAAFAPSLAQAGSQLLPTADTQVASLTELKSQLEGLGYSVPCIYGDASCPPGSLIQVDVPDGSADDTVSSALPPSTFDSLTRLPSGVMLQGTMDWETETTLSHTALGFDAGGFYVDGGSQIAFSVRGDGAVAHDGFALPYGGLSIDFDGTLAVSDTKPIMVDLSPIATQLRPIDFPDDPATTFNIGSQGEVTLDVIHSLDPSGLTYTGTWNLDPRCTANGCSFQEISASVDYPSADDWLQAGVGLVGAAIDTLLGPEAAAGFDTVSLPLIADTLPSDTAPSLVGTNPAEFNEPETSWMSTLMGTIRGLFSTSDTSSGSEGLFATEGDQLIQADVVRADRSVDGSGIKIGVISNGVAGMSPYAMATGDLPAGVATFGDSLERGGRGTAMLEVIHDVAPGADLAIASATEPGDLFTAFKWLIDVQQVDIIVSDVVDYTESLFSRGPLTDFISKKLAERDVAVIQAAGNDGTRSYRDQLDFVTATLGSETATRQLHRFSSENGVAVTTLPVTIEAHSVARFVLQSDQPIGSPSARVVIRAAGLPTQVELQRLETPLTSALSRDTALPRGLDTVMIANRGGTPVTVELAIEWLSGDLPADQPTRFQLTGLGSVEFSRTAGSALGGVALLDDVLVVGATEISVAGEPAPYSSPGAAGERLPDVAGPAGVETSGFGTRFFGTFRGTSAAAAHVAASLALLKNVDPSADRAALFEALKVTAKPLGGGAGDLRAGAGLIDVLAAAGHLVPKPGDPASPPASEPDGYLSFLNKLPQFTDVASLTDSQIESLLSGGQDVLTDLMQMRITLSADGIGTFDAEWPFNFDGIGSFASFDIGGRVGIEATPDVTLVAGWDEGGWYIDVDQSELAIDLQGEGSARGVAFDTFGLGAGATVTARPYLDLTKLDRADDGLLRQDDLESLTTELQMGDISRVLPSVDTVDADLYGDMILAFLDYVDIDPALPNRPHGGDPFIVRGTARLQLDLTGPDLQWSFTDLALANPDIDGDDQPDYTLGALASNALQFGQTLLDGLEVPGFVSDLLGRAGLGGEARRDEPLEYPRGMLPPDSEIPEQQVERSTREAINGHLANALSNANGGDVDTEALREEVKGELATWLAGNTPSGGGSGEGETDQGLSILEQLEVLQRDATRPILDDPTTPQDEFEESLQRAITSYLRWRGALELTGVKAEDVADAARLAQLRTRLVNGLRYAIERAHVGSIQLHLDGAPLNHQYDHSGATPQLTQRGVIDRALEAVGWAQTAEFLGLATLDNGLSVDKALDDMVIRVVVDRVELVPISDDGRIGPDDEALLEVDARWQIRLPANGAAPDIDDLPDYQFGATIDDAANNISLILSGASNNNVVAAEPVPEYVDPLNPFGQSEYSRLVRGSTDATGQFRTAVSLGAGDTFAQVQVDIGFRGLGGFNTLTNRIEGRPSLELFGAYGDQDDSDLRSGLFAVLPGQVVALQARLRKGNGPFGDAPVTFYLAQDGAGSLDQVSVTTSRQIPRSAPDGTTTVFYTAPDHEFDGTTVSAAFFDGGTTLVDSVEIIMHPNFFFDEAYFLNGLDSAVPSSDATDFDAELDTRAGTNGELTEQDRTGLSALLEAWFDSGVKVQAEAARQAALSNSASAEELTRDALADYYSWIAGVNIIGQSVVSSSEQGAVELDLLQAMEALVDYRLSLFDGQASNDATRNGLTPLYGALKWARQVEQFIELLPGLDDPARRDPTFVLLSSGVQIELLPPATLPVGTSAAPHITGTADDGQLHVAARVVRRDTSGNVTAVVQKLPSGEIVPAPVRVGILPRGVAAEGQPFGLHPDDLLSLGSRLAEEGVETAPDHAVVPVARRAGDTEVVVNVGLGISGVLLKNVTVALRDPPELSILGTTDNLDDDSLLPTVTLSAGEKAVLQVSLRRNDLPIDGEVQLNVIGGGSLSKLAGDTGSLGVLGGIEYTPPASPPEPDVTGGISTAIVRYMQDGEVYTASIPILFEYDATGDDGEVIGTPDHIRAVNELAVALRQATSTDPETGLPSVDQIQFDTDAIGILRDWWRVEATDPAGEGSVLYWLQRVQSPADGGAHPIDTTWKPVAADRDKAYREAFDAAVGNWLQWRATVAALGFSPEQIIAETGPGSNEEARSLVGGAIAHAMDRVNQRCSARADEYRNPPGGSSPSDLLARLIQEGDSVLEYFSLGQRLFVFDDLVTPDSRSTLEDALPDFCYTVEIVADDSYLDGTPENATVHVQAGIRVDGVADLLLPPPTTPLVVDVRPVGNAAISGLGLGRTDADGIYDRTTASIGEGDDQLAVDVSVVFRFDNLEDPRAKTRARTLAYTSRRLTLDTTKRLEAKWATEREGVSGLSDRQRTVVNGERVLVEAIVKQGRQPVIGQPVYVSKLGQGEIDRRLHVTDSAGRIRLYYTPPADGVGRTQIGFAANFDGETLIETLAIDYTTDSGTLDLDAVFSLAHTNASARAGLHLAAAGALTVAGAEPVLDLNLLESIQREWLETGLNSDGSRNTDEPCGLRCRLAAATDSTVPISTRRELVGDVATEYFRWAQNNAQLGVDDRLETEDATVRTAIKDALETSIDSYVDDALNHRSASDARGALQLAARFAPTELVGGDGDSTYLLDGVIERLGYEVRVEDAELHGDPSDARILAEVRVYLEDMAASDGTKVTAADHVPIKVGALPLGFRLSEQTENVYQGLYEGRGYIVAGDEDLEIVLEATDGFARSKPVRVRIPGEWTFRGGVRPDVATNETGNSSTLPSLQDSITVFPGESFILEGRQIQGREFVPWNYPAVTTDLTTASPHIKSIEEIAPGRFRITAGDAAGTVSGTVSSLSKAHRESLTSDSASQLVVETVPFTITVSSSGGPGGESAETGTDIDSPTGLLTNPATIGALDSTSVPLAQSSGEAGLGSALAFDSIQLPFSGPLPSVGEFSADLSDWASDAFDLLHMVDLETIMGFLNGGLPAQPEELIRVKLDLASLTTPLPATPLAADFSGLLPDGFSGSVSLDRPEFDGRIVFGIDTSPSPFYVLTRPDNLTSKRASVEAVLGEPFEKAVRVGSEATELTAQFGVVATFSADEDLLDGVLSIPHAEGRVTTRVKVDFTDVAADTGKLRLHELGELANLRVGFDGDPLDSFEAIVEGRVTLPDLDGDPDNGNALADAQVVGAIFKLAPDPDATSDDRETPSPRPIQFQLRTGQLFQLPQAVRDRLATATVDRPGTSDVERDDRYEDAAGSSSDWRGIGANHPANLGAPTGRLTIGGSDPSTSDDLLALADAADWFRFDTTAVGNASSFVQIDFDSRRGDLDLELYRREGAELVRVRGEGLAFGNSARITLLGQPADTYYVKVFDDRDARNPFYALTIDPPGRLEPGAELGIDHFSVRDVALEINVDSHLELSGELQGRMLMTFGEQDDIPVELVLRAQVDTIADNPADNGGFQASLSTSLGGDSLATLQLRDAAGNLIPIPAQVGFDVTVEQATGGYVIFDYVSANDFKFAGLDTQDRWVMGSFDETNGWHVPQDDDWRAPAGLADNATPVMRLVIDGTRAELWAGPDTDSLQRVISRQFSENLEGFLGLGNPNGSAAFRNAFLLSGTVEPTGSDEPPQFATTLFRDPFDQYARPEWRTQRGIWRVEANADEEDRFVAKSTSLELGEWLLVDSATLAATIDVQFNDNNILTPPPVTTGVCDGNAGPDGCITAAIDLTDVNALLFAVGPDDQGTRLYPEREDSPQGLVAIRDGELHLSNSGVTLGAQSATAGLQDVIFVTLEDNPQIDLTGDLSKPLLSSGSVSILVPALSEDEDFVTISGATPGAPLFGLSKPTTADPIPEFLLFQDQVTIDFDTSLIQEKIDVNGVFPFTLEKVGLRFNDAGSADGTIGNLAEFDLLVAGQIDFENDLFDFSGTPLEKIKPILAVGQPASSSTAGRASSPSSYADTCTEIDPAQFPGFPPLCQNGFVSAEIDLGALLGGQPQLALKQLGPFYIGFQDLTILEDSPSIDGSLTVNGLIQLGEFGPNGFDGRVGGELSVIGNSADGSSQSPLGSLTVSGQFVGPFIDTKDTTNPSDDETVTRLELDWIGEASGSVGSFLDIDSAAIHVHTEFTNRATTTDPLQVSALIEPRLIDSGNICVELGPFVTICGSGLLNPSAGSDEPLVAFRSGSLTFGEGLGPLADVTVTAGGLGLGRDGTVYVLPAGYVMRDGDGNVLADFPDGAFIELASDQPGGLFGLPEWVPVSVRRLGLQFLGVADPSDPEGDRMPLTVSAPGSAATLGGSVIDTAIPLTDPENFRLLISGGLEGNDMFPVIGTFERLQVNLGALAGCVGGALQNNVDLDAVPGYLFDSPCEFPIEGLEGVTVGIEPMDFGPLSIGGVLGFGAVTFDRPVDPSDPNSPTEPQKVFYGRVEGELAISDVGAGVEVIFTQYGPVLGRIKAGVPIPLGTLVGAIGGPVGAGVGTASGFLLTGLEGGIVFDAEPLPVVHEPTDIFNTPSLRTPLEISSSDIENAVRDLAMQNPTFSELVSLATGGEFAGENLSLSERFLQILQGRIPEIPVKFTWDDGFRVAVSGTLTNQYVAAQVGLGVTLGANVGYDFSALTPTHPNGAPAQDDDGYALDANGHHLDTEGNPVADGITSGLATFDELFGFQLFGFADIEIFNMALAGAGVLLDFSDPINPVFNVAASLPAKPGLLSLLLPSQGQIGLQLDFDGYLEGSILGTLVFLDQVREEGAGIFHDVLQALSDDPPGEQPSPLASFVLHREADRRQASGLPLDELDPRFTAYSPDVNNPDNPLRNLWKLLLDVDENGTVDAAEHRPITRSLVVDRILGNPDANPPVPSLMPDPLSADFASLDVISLAQFASVIANEIVVRAPELIADNRAAEALTAGIPYWATVEAQLRAVHESLLLTVDSDAARGALQDAFETSLNGARVQVAFSHKIAEAAFNSANAAAQKFAEIVDPSVRLVGQLSPMLFGFPMGPPSQSVDVLVDKHELRLRGEFSSLAQAFNMVALPALVKDRTEIDVYFPFQNLLADLYRGEFPAIDPLASDWRVGLGSSFSILGMEVSNSEGLIVPADATEVLLACQTDLVDGACPEGQETEEDPKLQVYYPPGDPLYDPNATIIADRILVRSETGAGAGGPDDHLAKLLAEGGLLVDGRLTLPRIVTEPLALLNELANTPIEDNKTLADLLAELLGDCDDVFECLAEHPAEVMQLVAALPDLIGNVTTIQEVAQTQLFIPNFVDDVIASFDSETRSALDALLDPTTAPSVDGAAALLRNEVAKALGVSFDVLQDAYLVGTYGRLPEPFGEEAFESSIPDPNDATNPPPYPTTSKILGIELGNGRITGEVTDNGFDLDVFGTFLGLADARFEVNLNTAIADRYDDTNGNGVFDHAEPIDPLADRAPIGVYNAAESWTDTNGNGAVDAGEFVDLDGNGVFDALGDRFVDLNFNGVWDAGDTFTTRIKNGAFVPTSHDVNGNGKYDPAMLRAGAELVVGQPPEQCTISPSAFQGADDVAEVRDQILSFLAHVGYSDEIDTAAGTIGDAFDWLRLDQLDASAGLCLRGFSPGFDADSSDTLRRTGGIEAHAAIGFDQFLSGDFSFEIQPSTAYPLVPNVTARGSARQILLPGLTGLSPDNPAADNLASSLELSFEHQDGQLSASLAGTLTLLGHDFTLAQDADLQVFDEGIAGEIALEGSNSLASDLFSIDGDFTLKFDTRPASPANPGGPLAAVIVSGNVVLPGFSLTDATLAIQVDQDGLHVTDVSGAFDLFDVASLDFSGRFSITPLLIPTNIDLQATASIDATIGPGDVHGDATVVMNDSGLSGTFSGYGTVFGVGYGGPNDFALAGTFDAGGCLSLTQPVSASFELPGSGAACGAARDVTLALVVDPDSVQVEGDPSGSATQDVVDVSIDVTLTSYAPGEAFKISIPWNVTATNGAVAGDDFTIPTAAERVLIFDESTSKQTIDFGIVRDRVFEDAEDFTITLDESALQMLNGNPTVFLGRASSTVTIANDDEPDLSGLNPPSDTLVYFDFDDQTIIEGKRQIPTLTSQSVADLGPVAPHVTRFHSSSISYSSSPSLTSAGGLPIAVDGENGSIGLAQSKAVVGKADNSFLEPPNYFEFTVDPKQGGWLVQGVDFFSRRRGGHDEEWFVTWSFDGFAEPILSSIDPRVVESSDPVANGWTRNHLDMGGLLPDSFRPVQGLLCTEAPVTFRLSLPKAASGTATNWNIDNLALTGQYFGGGCSSLLDDSREQIEGFLNQQEGLLPAGFELIGPGDVTARIIPEPGNVDPDPRDVIEITVTGTSAADTIVRLTDNGTAVPPAQQVPIYISVDGDVYGVDLTGADLFSGVLDVDGVVTGAIHTNGVASGSKIFAEGSTSQPLVIVGDAPYADGVTIDVLGTLGSLQLDGGWSGGLLGADQVDEIMVTAGDFGPTVDITESFGAIDVIGGNFTSSSFESGCNTAVGAGNDETCIGGEAIRVAAAGGVGGSIYGNITVAGSLGQLTATGGSIDASIDVSGSVELVQASVDETTGSGGGIAGNMQFESLAQLTSIGGTITTILTTLDPNSIAMQVDAVMYQGYGGVIDSPNSFHIAGGVRRISGNQINLRVEAGGTIESIVAVEEPGAPAMLQGRFTGGRFGEVRISGDGDANFTLTTTDEAWELDGRTAFELIDLPAPDALAEMLRLQRGVQPGEIRIAGEPIDYLDGDGIVPATGRRLEALWEGFQFDLYIVPASWQNYARPLDVNDDQFVTPLDALTTITELNRRGARSLDMPSVTTEMPPDYVDTNGDGLLSPLDVLRIIEGLTGGSGEGEAVERRSIGPLRLLTLPAMQRHEPGTAAAPTASQPHWHDLAFAQRDELIPIPFGQQPHVELDWMWMERSFELRDAANDSALMEWLEEEDFKE